MMRSWPALILGLICLGCGSGDGPIRPTTPGEVRGRVTRIENGDPVTGAKVILIEPHRLIPASPTAVTDDVGGYRFPAVPPGDYALFVYTDDLLVFDRSHPVVHLDPGATALQNVRLLASALWNGHGYRVKGRVVNAATGEPIAGAFVSGILWAWDDVALPFQGYGLPEWGVTDDEGKFSVSAGVFTDEMGEMTGLEPISVTRDGFDPATVVGDGASIGYFGIGSLPLPAPPDSSLTVEVRLHPRSQGAPDPADTGAIRGRALEAGKPIGGLPVAVSLFWTAHGDTFRTAALDVETPIQGNVAVTDAAGRFLVTGLAPGAYAVHPGYTDGDGYWLIEAPMVEVTAADTADAHDLALARAIRPLAPAEGSILSDSTPLFRWESFNDSAGVFVYDLQYATSHIAWTAVRDLLEPRWQTPDSSAFAPGARVRWTVEVHRRGEAGARPTPRGVFEHAATFIVRS